MAVTTLDYTYCTYKIHVDTDLGTSPVTNITDGAGTVYSIQVDNTANSGQVYLKLYDNLVDGGIDQNGTEADYIIGIDGSSNRVISFPSGLVVTSGLSLRCVAGYALSNVSDPGQNVSVKVVYSYGIRWLIF